jgi:drug/metabolite transporter (DMT)-like permease
MPFFALSLALAAAILHGVWNFFAKSTEDSTAFLWWVIAWGMIVNVAAALLTDGLILPLAVVPIFLPSLAAEIAYVYALTRGYADGDLSQVYPIARGSAPLFIALWSALFIAERLPLVGYVGIALLIVGVYLASLRDRDDLLRPLRSLSHRPAQWALFAGVCISIYTLLDRLAMTRVSALTYNTWVYVGITIGFAPFVWTRARRGSTLALWHARKARLILSGVMSAASYLFALLALSLTNASYVGAVRGTSVVIGAALGWIALKEGFGKLRVVAALLMVAGLVALAFAE